MRTFVVVAILVASTAAGEPAAKRTTFADWVGTYDAKLAWSGCTAPGAKAPRLALEAVDGVLSIDLAPASPGLRAMSLVADEHGWSAQQGDVKVTLARDQIAIELESGCFARGTLRRVSTGVAACDRFVAWAAVESKCTKLATHTEGAIPTKFKPADAAGCTARADRLEHALVDAGCAPHPDPLIGVRARECLELVSASVKLQRCGRVPPALAGRIVREAQALSSAAQTAERATLPYVEQQCRDARTTVTAVATQFSCPQ